MSDDLIDRRLHLLKCITGILCCIVIGYFWGYHEGLCFISESEFPQFHKEHCE